MIKYFIPLSAIQILLKWPFKKFVVFKEIKKQPPNTYINEMSAPDSLQSN